MFVRFQNCLTSTDFCVLKKTVNTPDPANQVFQAYLKSTWFVWSMVCVLCDLAWHHNNDSQLNQVGQASVGGAVLCQTFEDKIVYLQVSIDRTR